MVIGYSTLLNFLHITYLCKLNSEGEGGEIVNHKCGRQGHPIVRRPYTCAVSTARSWTLRLRWCWTLDTRLTYRSVLSPTHPLMSLDYHNHLCELPLILLTYRTRLSWRPFGTVRSPVVWNVVLRLYSFQR